MKQICLVMAISVLGGLVPRATVAQQSGSQETAAGGDAAPIVQEDVQGNPARASQESPVRVAVENNAYPDMHIYVVYAGGLSRSLGMVTGLSKRTLVIPRQLVQTHSDIQLLADPIGGSQGYLSETLFVSPGERVRFTIQNLPSLSSAWIEAGQAAEDGEDADAGRADTHPSV